MKRGVLAKTIVFAATFSLLNSITQAAEPESLGEFGDWTAYVYVEDSNKVCYMLSKPEKEEGDYTKRGNVYALITHRPAEKSKNVFSFNAGYSFKPASEVTISIGSQRFKLFTQNETAWAPDSQTDNRLAAAIRGGNKMIVSGTSSKGTATTDTFSLKGSTAAYAAISKECGIR